MRLYNIAAIGVATALLILCTAGLAFFLIAPPSPPPPDNSQSQANAKLAEELSPSGKFTEAERRQNVSTYHEQIIFDLYSRRAGIPQEQFSEAELRQFARDRQVRQRPGWDQSP